MSSATGYPSSLTRVTPHGPCTLTLTCLYPQDHAVLPRTPAGTDTQAHIEIACPQLKIEDDRYHAYILAEIDESDLSAHGLTVHIRRPARAADRRAVPEAHRQLWQHLALTVLAELLTRENFELLRRADAYRALQAAKGEVDTFTASLKQAHEGVRFYEVLTAVLALEDPTRQAIGLRLAGTWLGTAEQLLTVVHAVAEPPA